ncbi:cell cycle transcriptional regulator TrcR, partial [Bartonella sp. MR168JLCBS]|uniref:cell cycle transcriptional regulator TrcR n=1 Tax=Bartonella sp. MR168JLCBS TaxID=3243556 RepID=UPI0035CF0F14
KNARLKISESKVHIPEKKRKGARYIPLSRRQDRPNGILWLVINHPELKDAQIARLIGTTKATIEQIRHRTHWNSANLVPLDPVGLGLCLQIDLDIELQRAAKNHTVSNEADRSLLPASVTENIAFHEAQHKQDLNKNFDADKVFAKLNALQKSREGDA